MTLDVVDLTKTSSFDGAFQALAVLVSFLGNVVHPILNSRSSAPRDFRPHSNLWVFVLPVSAVAIAYIFASYRECYDIPNLINTSKWLGILAVFSFILFLILKRLFVAGVLLVNGEISKGVSLLFADLLYVTFSLSLVSALATAGLHMYLDRIYNSQKEAISVVVRPEPMREHQVDTAGNEIIYAGHQATLNLSGVVCCGEPIYEYSKADGLVENGLYTAPSAVTVGRTIKIRVKTAFEWDGHRDVFISLKEDPKEIQRYTASVGVKDKGGREYDSGIVDLIVLTDKLSWAFNKYVLSDGRELGEVITNESFGGIFSSYTDIVGVGTASHEFSLADPDAEFQRAGRRASIVAEAVCRALPPTVRSSRQVLALNIGRYIGVDDSTTSPELSAPERRVVIFGVVKRMKTLDVKSEIRLAMERKVAEGGPDSKMFEIMLEKYSPDWGRPEHQSC